MARHPQYGGQSSLAAARAAAHAVVVVPVAERVAASTAAQRADAFIDAIIMPVLDNKLLPTSGGHQPPSVSPSR